MLDLLTEIVETHRTALRANASEWNHHLSPQVPRHVLRAILLHANALYNVTDYALRLPDLSVNERRDLEAARLTAQSFDMAARSALCVGKRL